MKSLILLLFAFAISGRMALEQPVAIKDVPFGGRITNGSAASQGEVPYIVGLSFSSSAGSWWCSGSIIGHTWIVTAAHCTRDADSVSIRYGATLRDWPQFSLRVSREHFVQHESYNPQNMRHDIALIETPAIEFGQLINKVELPMLGTSNGFEGWWVKLCGWGKTSDESTVTDQLNCADVQISDNAVCQAHYGDSNIAPSHLCYATPDNKGSCGGDSGGPLVLHEGRTLVGIVSFGSSDGCLSHSPKGTTRVTAYLDWIRDNTGIWY